MTPMMPPSRPSAATVPASHSVEAAHHTLTGHEVVLLLETDPLRGLTDDEADRATGTLRAEHPARGKGAGRGADPAAVPSPADLRAARRRRRSPPGCDEYVDSAVIFGVVLVNAAVGFIQESKAEAALDACDRWCAPVPRWSATATSGASPRSELVPGDLVLLEAGDKVPADLRLVRQAELRVDESALTGESVPVTKDEVVLPEADPGGRPAQHGLLRHPGDGGQRCGIVVATGAETELGEIHRLVGAAETLATPLTEKLARFSKVLTVAILGLAALTFAVGLLRGQDAAETFTAAIALAVGAIPEGLPAAVTITLAIGVARMARRRAVIRRLPAVETLGSTTVICSDKTGTLTENQMTVRDLVDAGRTDRSHRIGLRPRGELCDSDRAAGVDRTPTRRCAGPCWPAPAATMPR